MNQSEFYTFTHTCIMYINSLHLKENYPLKDFTTFKIGGPAKYVFEVHAREDVFRVLPVIQNHHLNVLVLGGGSNILVSDHGFDGIVLNILLEGVEIVAEDAQVITLKVAAGECWDGFVAQAVSQGWWGIENLSSIPGKAGAFAIQNVGAYGQEACEVIEYVEVCEIATGDVKMIPNSACHFSYRTSVFNAEMKGKYIILSIVLKLKKHGEPNMRYHDVKDYFEGKATPTLQQMREAIIHIRERKLPDPEQLGNAGSFFKNLSLSLAEFERLKDRIKFNLGGEAMIKFEALRPTFSIAADIKIPTALLLDGYGLKGTRVGGAALYEKHPLIIVNATGRATAHDVMSLMKTVRQRVFQTTGIKIIPEPNLIGFTKEELQWYFLLE
jgi:UDP-N-acetylmuramate dehydrogenase